MRKRGEIELQRDLFISQRGGNGNAESDATAPPVARSATNSKESENKFLFPAHPSSNKFSILIHFLTFPVPWYVEERALLKIFIS